MKDSATSNLGRRILHQGSNFGRRNPSTWSQKPSGVFVVLDAFWCVGVVFEFSSCLVVLLLVLVCLQIFVVFGCLWCIDVSLSFRCVWCFFGVLVWCLHFFSCWMPFWCCWCGVFKFSSC